MMVLPKLVFGIGARRELASELALLRVERPFLMTDRGIVQCGVFDQVAETLHDRDPSLFDTVPENPTYDAVDRAAQHYKANRCDGIVAVGGGSVIDTAKLVAVLGAHSGRAETYVGHSERITNGASPLIVLPTTAGTGSEASPDAGIHPDSCSISSGISSPLVVPKVAICDPALTATLPKWLTAATGLDALSHCIEGYLSTTIAPPIDAMALDGIRRIWQYLPRATMDGTDLVARSEVMMAAFEGGAAIAKGLGPGHAIAISCGDQGLHHGVLSALGLIASLELMQEHVPDRVRNVGDAMGLEPRSSVAAEIRALMTKLELPTSLAQLGYEVADLDALAHRASVSHFNQTSPFIPDTQEFVQMISGILR
ncbi:iron-containing alcohol dehydrogenase [Bradyrhizobium jicamae]|uniref:iron-containing alcohol dehydrogenase n=1 Tax=Bradyrhizobium jicamae TaxID=280332 RepID=UPI001BA9A27F|nr:iron-containing alcohol dehydrogenase [Bradyrhizobium jicamae]MBR0755279.1 iron-containing alcohol dehydrogenase [Bradyrhizobium jicamae]